MTSAVVDFGFDSEVEVVKPVPDELVTEGRIKAAIENKDEALLAFLVCVGTTVSSSIPSDLFLQESVEVR